MRRRKENAVYSKWGWTQLNPPKQSCNYKLYVKAIWRLKKENTGFGGYHFLMLRIIKSIQHNRGVWGSFWRWSGNYSIKNLDCECGDEEHEGI